MGVLSYVNSRYPGIIRSDTTIIASQATISASFSLASQAVKFGVAPPFTIKHTSSTIIGQIYVPAVNFVLLVISLAIVVYLERNISHNLKYFF